MNKDKLKQKFDEYVKNCPLSEERVKELLAFMQTLTMPEITNMMALASLKTVEQLEDMANQAPNEQTSNFMWCCALMKWERVTKGKSDGKRVGRGTVQQKKKQVHPPTSQEDES